MARALSFVSLLFVSVFALPVIARAAAAPTFLMTWQASNSYVPAAYAGKALPGAKASISASLELISGGKPVNLKSIVINWYLDDAPIATGAGLQHVTFTPDASAPGSMELRVEIPNYGGSYLIHSINIPIAQPKAVIEGAYPGGEFSGNSITVKALSYFFADPSSALSYQWAVNGVPAQSAENPDVAQINIPAGAAPGSTISTSLVIGDNNDGTTAQAISNLTYGNNL